MGPESGMTQILSWECLLLVSFGQFLRGGTWRKPRQVPPLRNAKKVINFKERLKEKMTCFFFAAVGGRNLTRVLHSSKTALYAIMYAKTREIRIVEDPHLSDPSWEGGRGVPQLCMRRDICAELSDYNIPHAG